MSQYFVFSPVMRLTLLGTRGLCNNIALINIVDGIVETKVCFLINLIRLETVSVDRLTAIYLLSWVIVVRYVLVCSCIIKWTL